MKQIYTASKMTFSLVKCHYNHLCKKHDYILKFLCLIS